MELHFTRTNGPADEAIDQLIDLVKDIDHPGLVRELILVALKAGQENGGTADLKLMNSSLKEMRFTAKVFRPYRHIKKVTVFGSARTPPGKPLYELAHQFGQELVKAGYMVITGGGGGIMQAVNEGAGPDHSFGVSIRLPFEQKINHILDGNPRNINYKYFFNRKVAFIKEADAVALFPGGFGTLDEAMEILTLVQTGKRYPIPLILVDEPSGSYWDHCITFFEKELLSRKNIDAEDFHFFEQVTSAMDGVRKIDRFYRRYHSLRYVSEQLVIRLTSELAPEAITALNKRFSDILVAGGHFKSTGPLPEESDEPDILQLPRLTVDFNKKSYGRLRTLIDFINDAA